MKDLVEIRNFWQEHKSEPLVLCTLVKKTGSSYRNVGAKKIISLATGQTAGLLSGGCLEGDIERSAQDNADNLPFTKMFSTMSEEDRLMGYQTGCSGEIEILFEKLPSGLENLDQYVPYDPIQLTIIGCGADADSYIDFGTSLGWRLRFFDYRSDLTESQRFGGVVRPELLALDKIADQVPLGPKSAVVLMTHNFESDLKILSQLNKKEIGYVGLLGPKRRYELLKQDLKNFYEQELDVEWEKRVKAPPGITSRNYSPSEIAFSIVADIQLTLNMEPASA